MYRTKVLNSNLKVWYIIGNDQKKKTQKLFLLSEWHVGLDDQWVQFEITTQVDY